MPEHINEQHSQEMEALIGHVPHWIIRAGISCMLGVAILALIISTWIHYPETVKARAMIVSNNKPDRIPLDKNNKEQLSQILVQNGQQVNTGDTLTLIQNSSTGATTTHCAAFSGTTYIIQDSISTTIWLIPEKATFDVLVRGTDSHFKFVKPGQSVSIKTDQYTDEPLEGKIDQVMHLQADEYQASVKLNKEMPPGAPVVTKGEAIIQISNKSLFDKIFGSILADK